MGRGDPEWLTLESTIHTIVESLKSAGQISAAVAIRIHGSDVTAVREVLRGVLTENDSTPEHKQLARFGIEKLSQF